MNKGKVRSICCIAVFVIVLGSLLFMNISNLNNAFAGAKKSDVTNPPKVTDKDAINLGSDCTKNMDGTYSCTRDEILKEDETNDDYNSSAKTPNTGGPVPIPYPNTNN